MIRSSFSGLSGARLALLASQNGLDITMQNISNVKTGGYTRQRLNQVSLNGYSLDQYTKDPSAYIGYGVEIRTTEQIRDPFIDVRYRLQMSKLGTYDRKQSVLTDIEGILNETDTDALAAQLSEMSSALSKLQGNASDTTYDGIVRSSAQRIAEYLNEYSNRLTEQKNQCVSDVKNDCDALNDALKRIQELNESIQNCQVHGASALELQDERNLLIDSLSTYGEINVNYTTENMGNGQAVDHLKITMTQADGSKVSLIDGVKASAQFTYVEDAGGKSHITIKDTTGTDHADFQFNNGSFKSALSMLNESGTFDDPATSTNGFGYYQKMLDSFAATFAKTFNDLNNTGAAPNQDLFAGGPPVTAANIRISDGWQNGSVHINCYLPTETGGNSNVLKMIAALGAKQDFSDSAGTVKYQGSFQECVENFRNVLSTDLKSTTSMTKTHLSVAQDIADTRDSVSGVNLDEETVNLMTYNKAFTAAARLVTALDEMLNTLLGMGVVGR